MLERDEAGEAPILPCVMCGDRARTIVPLQRRGVMPGRGWGCVQCGLPCDGAIAVLCDRHLALFEQDPASLTHCCRGYPAEDGVVPIADLPAGEFDHDVSKHPELAEPEELAGAGAMACRVCGCTDSRACLGGCHWVEPGLCSACAPVEQFEPAVSTLSPDGCVNINGHRPLFVDGTAGYCVHCRTPLSCEAV